MKNITILSTFILGSLLTVSAGELFKKDLSDSFCKEAVWSFNQDGELSSTKDVILWTKDVYENFELEVEVKVTKAGNGGIIVYNNDIEKNWIPNSIEIQVADNEYWLKDRKSKYYTTFGSIFGIQAPYIDVTKPLGEWNQIKIRCEGKIVKVWMNGVLINNFDMNKCTSATIAPDGNEIVKHLQFKPRCEVPTKGHIGFQGKHGNGNTLYRNIKITPIEK